ncbi:MAG: hypothetical protein M4579_002330 [Chaenotheca gracillima]|nr:MAG: hypothetical protein M4579_002330 [Chaenotheca gracillima]
MRFQDLIVAACVQGSLLSLWLATTVSSVPTFQKPLAFQDILSSGGKSDEVSLELFTELEELARLVDISYCVGTGGITKPFECASRCTDFPEFELVETWETGRLLSDSCGYIVLSHPPSPPRIILAFRGTYSIANTVADLSTIPQEYTPYPPDSDPDDPNSPPDSASGNDDCANCTVHAGFLRSWSNTRPHVIHHIETLTKKYPDYQIVLVGHSLGGAVAALAGLEIHRMGHTPHITTFGEPRVGNAALVKYIDSRFAVASGEGADARENKSKYYRVTHVDDPVPLLPLTEWGYVPHGNEIYISKPELSPDLEDLHFCQGDEDPNCIAGGENPPSPSSSSSSSPNPALPLSLLRWAPEMGERQGQDDVETDSLSFPARFKLWQLFWAHRDYFWRLGLCLPSADEGDGDGRWSWPFPWKGQPGDGGEH